MATEGSNATTETLAYAADGTGMQSYLAVDRGNPSPRPGILVVHEWWGLDDYIKRRARMLAELGFVALGVDLYGGGKIAADADEAGTLMNGVLGDIASAEARLEAARAALAAQPLCDGRIAGIGYCFGGAMVLHAARIGMPLAGVVSFHGALGAFHTPAPGSVKARILVCHGADDVLIPPEQVAAFREEMTAAGADFEFVAYDGARHGFSNPGATANGEKFGLPLAYDTDVDRRSWQKMRDFFAAIFG